MVSRKEDVYVLYGSQTGNSEQAAKELCEQFYTKLSPAAIQKLTGTEDTITVVPTHMQLDDFLELDRCKWTRLVVIVTSSYGVGMAPLGCYRFRELCDAWLQLYKGTKPAILDGMYFAMCGLGDSKYTTYFENPTKINESLHLVGAQRVGPLGKADASGTGTEFQQTVIARWMEGIWPHLANVVVKEPLSAQRLETMQNSTEELCRKINPDFLPKRKEMALRVDLIVAVSVVLLATALVFIFGATK
ncbi:predicted protein [Phaeodactylum tricornutum CCAP 1055/1]|jgi:sulfite reductase alpha subunit-like flavoprotein|uniref:Flavodoxin-like domain-containing protein n=2 Tax=Phaeodactylum tricornutum TaxID=2850 RepID=B7GBM0_PHATC|nr:predicted protein [Phaeodactylum tricornutum CCAP 1055/1]EEC43949.1 predicted protein [Phaeodactylum tricornutum CCAP 1055/1]|eukprot:XP_002184550.1 predicted protein [Phaeodactylum tricornutum CCAP 1055/1]